MEKEILKCCQNNLTIALLSPLGEQLNKFEFPSTKDEKLNMWRVQIDGRQQVISEANINFMIKWAKNSIVLHIYQNWMQNHCLNYKNVPKISWFIIAFSADKIHLFCAIIHDRSSQLISCRKSFNSREVSHYVLLHNHNAHTYQYIN